MKKLIPGLLILSFSLPLLSSAQTVAPNDEQTLIANLTEQVKALQAQIQSLIAARSQRGPNSQLTASVISSIKRFRHLRPITNQ